MVASEAKRSNEQWEFDMMCALFCFCFLLVCWEKEQEFEEEELEMREKRIDGGRRK